VRLGGLGGEPTEHDGESRREGEAPGGDGR
jgi:hypothetical protein